MRHLRTARLRLEPQTADHAEEMFVVLSDPAIYEFENGPPSSLEGLRLRYSKLESRQSADGSELWLNWVVRLSSGNLIGYVQATVIEGSVSMIAYEFSSQYWGNGYASESVEAMLAELGAAYRVSKFIAIFKSLNVRSQRLLERLGFVPDSLESVQGLELASDEQAMSLHA